MLMTESRNWMLIFQINGYEMFDTGTKSTMMERGRALVEEGSTNSVTLTNGKINAKCWWHAGRVEWSDFVPVGEFYTSAAKKGKKAIRPKMRSNAKKPIPYLKDSADTAIRREISKLNNEVYSTIDVYKRGDKFDALIILNYGTDTIPWKMDQYDNIFSRYCKEWDIKNGEAVMLYDVYPKYLERED